MLKYYTQIYEQYSSYEELFIFLNQLIGGSKLCCPFCTLNESLREYVSLWAIGYKWLRYAKVIFLVENVENI